MCLASEKSSNSAASAGQSTQDSTGMSKLTVETEDSFSSLLEVAANNDVEGFKRMVERDPSVVDEVGLWFVRKRGTKQIVQEERSPLMVAATYGSVDVLKLIVSLPDVDLNRSCGPNKCTALHCATSGGAVNAFDVVKLLLSAGADPNVEDAFGQRPVDVIAVPPKVFATKTAIQELLLNNGDGLGISVSTSSGSSPVLSSSPENGSPCSPSVLLLSPTASKFIDAPGNSVTERKEYPFDPSLPDIKNSVYSTDEFRMFMFKVRPCSRAYSHDWTECPFVHPGENARRRDPRKFHYSCVPCPEFRKGSCRRGDMCEYAHGVFESWLHPAQYRTRLCKDGPSCARRVCFFAHATEELRPLFSSTGSAIPSPRSASAASVMDMAAALNLFPCSPSSHSVMSPSAFSNPMSPTGNGMSHSSPTWPQPNVPTLHLPGSNLQSSRLRSSLSARDILPSDLNSMSEFDAQQLILNEMAYFSQPRTISDSLNRSGRSNTLTPSNLEDLFASEVINSSPRFADQATTVANGMFSPSHKSAILNQLQQQQSMLSPINTNMFSPKNVDHSLLQASYGVPSPGRMSPRCIDPASPLSARLNVREKHLQQARSFNSRDIGFNNSPLAAGGTPPPPPPLNSWTQWGSPNGKADWSVHGDELGMPKRQPMLEVDNGVDEPDVSWVQSLVKEPSPEMQEKFVAPVSGAAASSGEVGSKARSSQIDSIDPSVLGAWLEQMQLDQMVT